MVLSGIRCGRGKEGRGKRFWKELWHFGTEDHDAITMAWMWLLCTALMVLFHLQYWATALGTMVMTQSARSAAALMLPLLMSVLVTGEAQASPRPHIIVIVADDLVSASSFGVLKVVAFYNQVLPGFPLCWLKTGCSLVLCIVCGWYLRCRDLSPVCLKLRELCPRFPVFKVRSRSKQLCMPHILLGILSF